MKRLFDFAHGLRLGYRLAGIPLWRRVALHAAIAAILAGWTVGLIWATVSDAHREWRVFLQTQVLDGEPVVVKVTKTQARVKLERALRHP